MYRKCLRVMKGWASLFKFKKTHELNIRDSHLKTSQNNKYTPMYRKYVCKNLEYRRSISFKMLVRCDVTWVMSTVVNITIAHTCAVVTLNPVNKIIVFLLSWVSSISSNKPARDGREHISVFSSDRFFVCFKEANVDLLSLI